MNNIKVAFSSLQPREKIVVILLIFLSFFMILLVLFSLQQGTNNSQKNNDELYVFDSLEGDFVFNDPNQTAEIDNQIVSLLNSDELYEFLSTTQYQEFRRKLSLWLQYNAYSDVDKMYIESNSFTIVDDQNASFNLITEPPNTLKIPVRVGVFKTVALYVWFNNEDLFIEQKN